MSKTYQKKIGATGEKIAQKYLEKKGYLIIDRNFQVREGEIDLVCKLKDDTVFIEVKTRTSLLFGPPEESVSTKKQGKYALAIERYIRKKGLKNINWRFEIVSIFIDRKNDKIQVKHLKNL